MVHCDGRPEPFPVDAVIFATGYAHRTCAPPWLAELLRPPRYLHVWPNTAEARDRVAVVGFVRPYLTSIPMLIELQARWVATVFAGATVLVPRSLAERRRLTAEAAEHQRREFPCHADRMPFLVDPYDYSNAVAQHIGPAAAIPYERILRAGDWELLSCLLLDSWSPLVFRLNDPSAAKRRLARDTLLQYHRHHPTCRRIRQYTIFLAVVLLSQGPFWPSGPNGPWVSVGDALVGVGRGPPVVVATTVVKGKKMDGESSSVPAAWPNSNTSLDRSAPLSGVESQLWRMS